MQGEDDATQVVDTWRAPASYKHAWDQYDIHLSTSPTLQDDNAAATLVQDPRPFGRTFQRSFSERLELEVQR